MLATLLGTVIFLVPVACAVGVSLLVEHLVQRPSGTGALALWWIGLLAVSTLVFFALDVVARRALPLKVLLRMGLAFPGRAPKRLSVAWRAASVRDLGRMVADARERGIAGGDAEAMEKVVTLAAALEGHDRKTLLRMGVAFSGRATKRLAAAWRSADVHELDRMVAEARERGVVGHTVDAAEKIVTLAAALSAHDRTTRGHSERVRAMTDLIARELHLCPADRDRLRWSALLHDVGKLAVHSDILNKAADLDDDEWNVIRQHPIEGAKLTAPLAGWLGPWADTIAEHHERFDGKGYPKGLRGRAISLGGRIVAVADSYDVMTATRSYKRPLGPESARRELAACAGSQFDPDVVRAFLTVSMLRLRLAAPLSWLGSYGSARIGGLTRLAVVSGRSVATGFAVAGAVVTVTLAPWTPGARPALADTGSNHSTSVPQSTYAGGSPPSGDGTSRASNATTHGTRSPTDNPAGSTSAATEPRGTSPAAAEPPGATHHSTPKTPRAEGSAPATKIDGGAPPTSTSPLSDLPAPPTHVTATGGCQLPGTDPLISLRWTPSATPTVTSYIVLRSDNDVTFSAVGTVSSTTTTFTDTLVGRNPTYWFEVAAVSAAGTAMSPAVWASAVASCR